MAGDTYKTSGRRAAPREGNIEGSWVTGSQGNHGDYYLPGAVVHLADKPLYIAVAQWSAMAGVPVNRGHIAQAFRITPRRAADIMEYLVKSCRDLVQLKTWTERVASGQRVRYMSVDEVRDVRAPAAPPPRRAKPTRRDKKGSGMAEARDLFLGIRRSLRNAGDWE